MPRTWMDLLQNLLREAPGDGPAGAPLEPHAIIDEAMGWIEDPRPYQGRHHNQAWTSCFEDLDFTINAVGSALSAAIAPAVEKVRQSLRPLANQGNAPPDTARREAIAALKELQGSLRQPDAIVATWRDLVDAARDGQDIDVLSFRAASFVDLLRNANRSVDNLLRVIGGIIADGALWQLEARIQLGDETPPTQSSWPAPDTPGGLPEADRAALCERLVAAAAEPQHHVVWVAFDNAAVRVHPCITFGNILFFDAGLIRGAVTAGSSATPLPPELFGNHVGEHDIPQGDVVMARVDLGKCIESDAPGRARKLARGLVEAAVFRMSVEDVALWKPLDDYLHFIDGRYAGSLHMARDIPPPGRVAQEAVGGELQALTETALMELEWVAANVDSLEALTWFRQASGLEAAPRLMLDVRVLERVAVRTRSDDSLWWRYLDDFWKLAWVRHQIDAAVVFSLRNALRGGFMMPPEIEPEAKSAAATLLATVVRTIDTAHHEVNLPEGVRVLPDFARHFSPNSLWGRRLDTLAQRIGSPSAFRQWVEVKEREWDRSRSRAQRCRNALTHAGPVNARVMESASTFIHQLAAFALSEELSSVTTRADITEAHRVLTTNAQRWRARIDDVTGVADAFFGDPLTLVALSVLPRPGSGIDPAVCKSGFWNYLERHDLSWPDDVIEQFLFDHGNKPPFIGQYGHIDLRKVAWVEQDIAASVLIHVGASEHLSGRVDDVAENLDHYAATYGPTRWGWEEFQTWLRSPLLIDGLMLRPPRNGLHLVEGHSRIGALKGYVRRGVVDPRSRHRVWVGKEKE